MTDIEKFLNAQSFAVAGASVDRNKYGNKVFRAIAASGRIVYPLNPNSPSVEGQIAFAKLADLPQSVESLSLITPPQVTREIVQQAVVNGVKNIWMQPGAEDAQASQLARQAGINVIDDGSCILVILARESK